MGRAIERLMMGVGKDQKLPPHQTGMNATQRRERGRTKKK